MYAHARVEKKERKEEKLARKGPLTTRVRHRQLGFGSDTREKTSVNRGLQEEQHTLVHGEVVPYHTHSESESFVDAGRSE